MKISEGKVVGTSYTLYVISKDGKSELVEQINDDHAMHFIVGQSGLPEKYEENLKGLSAGDSYEFEIKSDDAFGPYFADDHVDFDVEMFQIEDGKIPEGLLEIGNPVPFTNDEGDQAQGFVTKVEDDKVFIDFNHPLAGKDLKFNGKIISVREATPEELNHGHVHGPDGHHHDH